MNVILTNGISAKDIWLSEINNLKQLLFIAGATAKNKDNAEIIESFDSTMKMLEEKTDEATNDIEEDFLSSIESETSRWMRAFKKRNFAEIEKQDKREFFFDIAIHYFRTKAARDTFQKRFQDIFSNTTLMEKFCKLQPNVNPANIRPESLKHPIFWGWQAALANSLYTKKACITLLVNETNTPLITCDRPLINLKANYEDLSQEVKNLAFYYPLYPSIAITIDADSSSEEIDTVKLSKQDVEEYNKKVVKASHEFIFANEKGILETILKDRNRTNA